MLLAISNALLAVALPTTSLANAPPARPEPIRLICPFSPADAVDFASRAITTELAKVLWQPVNVERTVRARAATSAARRPDARRPTATRCS